MSFSLADVVESARGRDAKRYFLVVGILDSDFVQICDGDLRKIDSPKKKRVKHLKATGLHADFIAQKLQGGQKVTNAEIRKNLQAALLGEDLEKEGQNVEGRRD